MIETIIGAIISDQKYSEKLHGYQATVRSYRLSGTPDEIPILLKNPVNPKFQYKFVGELKSYNEDGHLYLYMQVNEISSCDTNHIEYEGYVCKTPIRRTTPSGLHITEIIVAVNHLHMPSDYIPTIIWDWDTELHIGDQVRIIGRVQSRSYGKNNLAYEVSAFEIAKT